MTCTSFSSVEVLVHRSTIAEAWSRHIRGSMKMGGRATGEKGDQLKTLLTQIYNTLEDG